MAAPRLCRMGRSAPSCCSRYRRACGISGTVVRPAGRLIGAAVLFAGAAASASLLPASSCLLSSARSHTRCADRRGPERLAAPAVARSELQAKAPPAPLAFDGLEDLEELEDEPITNPSSRAIVALAKASPGDGIAELHRLSETYRREGTEPELDEKALAELHAKLAGDASKCPSVATVAWIVRELDELAIEEDDILEHLGQVLVERADELDPQSTLDVVCSYGNFYWAGDDVLAALAGAVRRQLDDFTVTEVARIASGLLKMGGTDTTEHRGLFFEIRQRVNIPAVDEFLRTSMNREPQWYRDRAEEARKALKVLNDLPTSKLRTKVVKLLKMADQYKIPKALEEAEAREEALDRQQQLASESFLKRLDDTIRLCEELSPPQDRFKE